MDRSVKVKKLEATSGRTIAISDIHGNYDRYLALLKKIHYRPNQDRLILVGDFIEKGPKNLLLLRYIMHQAETEDVHVLMGNCDFTCKNVLYSYRLEFLRYILLMRKASVMHEMEAEIHYTFDENVDMADYCQMMRKYFLKELSFVNDLPHVIETPDTIYVHAALVDPEHYGSDFKEVINQSFFLKRNIYFPKRVVVGHMPVTEYCHRIANFDPIYDSKMNVYSIDGGNIVKKQSGQLNALIFDGHTIQTESIDELPEVQVIKDVEPGTQLPIFVTWNEGKVDILQKTSTHSLVYNSYLKRKFWVPNVFIQHGKANEYTTYEMSLKKGDTVKLVCTYDDKAQIKKNGILGWTYKTNLLL